MKKIKLSQNQFALVDDGDFEWLNQWKWFAYWNPDTKTFYAARNFGKYPKRTTLSMHRAIMKTPKSMICDHINHNTLDNRKENLRNCTPSQSNMNRGLPKNSSGQNRISIRTKRGKTSYQVRISKGGKSVFDKCFGTLEDAIIARDRELKQAYGEFLYMEDAN